MLPHVTHVGRTEIPRCVFSHTRGHREPRETRLREVPRNGREFGNCRLRQFGETVGTVCDGGFLPPSIAHRAPDGGSGGGGGPPGKSDRLRTHIRAVAAHPRQATRARASRRSLRSTLAVDEPGTRSRSHDDTRAFLSPRFAPLSPFFYNASARATGRLVATGLRHVVKQLSRNQARGIKYIPDWHGAIDINRRGNA